MRGPTGQKVKSGNAVRKSRSIFLAASRPTCILSAITHCSGTYDVTVHGVVHLVVGDAKGVNLQ